MSVDAIGFRVSKDMAAAALMGAAVLGWAFVPLVVAWGTGGNGQSSPFIFNAAYKMGMAAGCVTLLLLLYRPLFFNKRVWSIAWSRMASFPMLLWIVAFFDLGFFAWATSYIDISVTAVLFEIWPILLVVLMSRLFPEESRYRKVTIRTLFLFLLAFLGVASVIFSQAGSGVFSLDSSLSSLGVGIGLVALAAVSRSLSAFGFKWASSFAEDMRQASSADREGIEMFGVLVGTLVCCVTNVVFTMSFGFARNEPIDYAPLTFGFTGGLVLGAFGALAWRKANLMTQNLSYNVMVYMTPVLSLAILIVFSMVREVNLGYLFFGTAAIVIANVGVYLQIDLPQQREAALSEEPEMEPDITTLIAAGESEKVEFKSSLRTNFSKNERDRRVEGNIIKSLAGFLNSDGGTLIVGVNDNGMPVRIKGKVMGIKCDGFDSEDRMSLYLRDLVINRIGPVAMSLIRLRYYDYGGVRVLAARCSKSDTPVFVREGRNSRFYVRTGPSTSSLSVQDAMTYMDGRFQRQVW